MMETRTDSPHVRGVLPERAGRIASSAHRTPSADVFSDVDTTGVEKRVALPHCFKTWRGVHS